MISNFRMPVYTGNILSGHDLELSYPCLYGEHLTQYRTWIDSSATCKIHGNFQRFSTADLYQFTTGTPSERSDFHLFCKPQYSCVHTIFCLIRDDKIFGHYKEVERHTRTYMQTYTYTYVHDSVQPFRTQK
jgi:hypothetical protein